MKKILAAIRDALLGVDHDYTQGSIPKAVLLLAVPMILELSLESVFAIVDIFFVSKLGEDAIATVGLTESMVTIVYSIAIGLSAGAGAIVARRTGEKEREAAAHAGAQAMLVGIGVSILTALAGIFFAEDLLRLMGASESVVRDGAIFTKILFGGSTVIILLFVINGAFRGAGNAAMAMKSLWLASLTNIILCPILIHNYGLPGAAVATVIGRTTGVLYQCYHLGKANSNLRMTAAHFKLDFPLIRNVINISWPATFQFIIASGSWIVLARLIADTGGTTASAGYQIAIRNIVFFILPAWGLSNAAATLVGQNLGAKKPERAVQSVNITLKFNLVFMALVSALFIFFNEQIIAFYSKDPEIISIGAEALQIVGYGYIFYGLGMVMVQALNGAGDTKTPTWINFICFWLFQIPFAYLLVKYFNLGITGAFIAIPVAESLIAVLSWLYFVKGKWKTVQV